MTDENVTGADLQDIGRNELLNWGIKTLGHRVQIEKHIQKLCAKNENANA